MCGACQNMNKNALTYGLTSFLINYAAIGSPLKWKLRFHRQLGLLWKHSLNRNFWMVLRGSSQYYTASELRELATT